MKNSAILLLAVALLSAPVARAAKPAAPPMPTLSDGQFGYEETVAVDGVSADDLYARAKVFIVDAYKSANAVVQMDDPQLHRLVARGVFDVPWMGATVSVEHKLTIEVRDGRYRYRLDGFLGVWANGESRSLQDKWIVNTKIVPRTAAECDGLISSMKVAMAQAPKNW